MKIKTVVNKAYSFKEAEEFDREFWRKAGAEARFSAAWHMVIEYLKMKGKNANQHRLRRTVQSIERLGN